MLRPGPHDFDDLYHTDFYAWTRVQAASLRRLEGGSKIRGFDPRALADEVDALGRAERDAAREYLRDVLVTMLKLRYSTAEAPRRAWEAQLTRDRAQLGKRLTPSLEREIGKDLQGLYAEAAVIARRALELRAEVIAAARVPGRCPFVLADGHVALRPDLAPGRLPPAT
jgi:hypothetical protein